MGRLIDADALLKEFDNTGIQITFDLPVEEILGEGVDLDDFYMLVQDAIQAYKKTVIETIKEQSTAYDVEAVVAELEKESKEYEKRADENNVDTEYTRYYAISEGLDKAISIVRGKE